MPLIKRNYETGYHDALFYREVENSQRNRARLRMAREFSPGGPACLGQPLLEIGCGTGGFLRVANAAFAVEGVDISHSAVAAAQEQFGERVRVANVQEEALPARRYAVVAAFNILEHLPEPALALRAISAGLQPGGVLIGSVPYNAALLGRAVTRLGNYIDRTHVSTYPPDQWRGLFVGAGFGHVKLFGEIPFGRNRAVYLRGRIWKTLALNLVFVCRV